MTTIEESICKLQDKLQGIPKKFAFLGGSVLSLLITERSVDAIRVTKDIDVVMDIQSRKEFHSVDAMLESIGFKHDTREDAPICRWICDGITVDVLPIQEDVLGWNSKWFDSALDNAEIRTIAGKSVRIISAPYFVALKLEAFEDRGKGDFLMSTDFEDIICLFNGRGTIVDEISASGIVRDGLAKKFKEYLKSSDLEDAVEGFVQTERNPEQCKRRIMSRFASVASLVVSIKGLDNSI